jgi:NADH dehydrogenase
MNDREADSSLFLTGGTGFIGRPLLTALEASGKWSTIRCLTRRQRLSADSNARVQVVRGDLTRPDTYRTAVAGCDVVVHLAATTGRARPDAYYLVNAEGTRRLLEASRDGGVSRFVHVSSIAATFRESRAYHYGHSKAQAEEAVRTSGIEYAIVRPTIIIGRESPVWTGLVALASLPVSPVFGNGQVLVQPIDIDDVVRCLIALAAGEQLPNRAVEVGGPDVFTLESLLRTIRRGLGRRDSRIVHIPVRSAISILARTEGWLYPLLPVTAGQLSLFVNDTVASPDPLVQALGPMTSVQQWLQRRAAHE